MPINLLEDNELLIRCACGSTCHIAFLTHEPDDSHGNKLKGEHDDWYLSVLLDNYPFWGRVRRAFKYIFSPHSLKDGMYTDLVLCNEDVDQIVHFIARRRAARLGSGERVL